MEGSGRTLVCSVLFLDIVEYSKKPVAEQLQLKQAFNQALASALENIPTRDRIILDTGDGAAVTFMGDPEDALFAAITMRDLGGPFGVRMGVNLGPVRLVKDLNGQVNIIGDGINVAQRVMSFAAPGQLLVSRSFYEVVSCLSRDYASFFHHEGSRTDKHVREHDVYSLVGGTPTSRRLSDTGELAESRPADWLRSAGPLGLRRSALLAAPILFLLLVAGGVGARALMDRDADRAAGVASRTPGKPLSAPRIEKAATAPLPAAAAKEAAPAGADSKPEAPKKTVARVERKPEKPQAPAVVTQGRLLLAVAPWGEVVVDGKSRGLSPPLRSLEISPGPHTIEIRNSTFPAYMQRIEVKAGDEVRIRHRFR